MNRVCPIKETTCLEETLLKLQTQACNHQEVQVNLVIRDRQSLKVGLRVTTMSAQRSMARRNGIGAPITRHHSI